MCGRYYLHITMERLLERYGIKEAGIDFSPRDEVFPTESAPVVLAVQTAESDNGQRGKTIRNIRLYKWGFSPFYGKRPVINARAETIDSKPLFREPFRQKRCLIPVSGFFEWQGVSGQKKKYRIFLADEEVISLAGLYNTFRNKAGEIESCFTIITTAASSQIRHIHDRMPVILKKNRESLWLTADNPVQEDLKALLKPYNGSDLALQAADPEEPAQLGFDFD